MFLRPNKLWETMRLNWRVRPLFCAWIWVCAAVCPAAASSDDAGLSLSVDRAEYVTATDGARLYLTTRGARRDAPLLLWLHGGPGGAETPLFRYFNGELEDRFLVAYWDQRGAGRSFDSAADLRALTIARHLMDLDLVVERLRSSFDTDKIILIGHSWGGTLALLYAGLHPQKLAAVIVAAPSVATHDQEKAEFEFVSKEAERRHDADALAKLGVIGPPPYSTAAKGLSLERLADRFGAVFHRKPNKIWVMIGGILLGLVAPWEIPGFIRANEASLEAMRQELQDLDLRKRVPRLEIPAFFFLGRYDRHVDSTIVADYFDRLRAPVKRLVWFESSAHNLPFEEPHMFDAQVADSLRSLGILAIPR